ncbi:MAG: tetratricopeptide repeat protein [Candidatus Melainabacteria bacterium]|nr:MAG: tetratricopeptide repeat protein [Candidatus Melainabacteria bacterium]
MKKTSSLNLLAYSFALAACFSIELSDPVFAANVSQATIDLIERDLKDAKTSGRDFSKEIAELKETVESKDASPQLKVTCYRLLSGISANLNDMSEALAFIEKAYALDPTNKDVLAQRAFAHSLDSDRKKVVDYYTDAIAACPELSWLYFNRGSALQGMELHKEAIQDFEKAATLSAKDQKAMAYILKINSLFSMSEFKSVIETSKNVSFADLPVPLKADYYRALGYSQLRENQFQEGIKSLTQALTYSSSDKEKALIHHFLAIGHHKLNQKEKAAEEASLAEKLGYRHPGSPPPDRVAPSSQELTEALKPLIVQARATLPDAKKRYLAGLPSGHFMSVTTGLTDKNGHHEQVFVTIDSWTGDVVNGRLANDVSLEGYKRGQALKVNEKDMLDWTIVNPKGEEEGNVLGKFIDKWLDERQSK